MVYVMIPLLTEELRTHGNVRELVRRSLGPLLARCWPVSRR